MKPALQRMAAVCACVAMACARGTDSDVPQGVVTETELKPGQPLPTVDPDIEYADSLRRVLVRTRQEQEEFLTGLNDALRGAAERLQSQNSDRTLDIQVSQDGDRLTLFSAVKDSTTLYEGADLYIDSYDVGKYGVEASPYGAVALFHLLEIVIPRIAVQAGPSNILGEVIGTADGIHLRPGASYAGDLGDIVNVRYYSEDEGKTKYMTLKPGDPLTNESVAFLRAWSLRQRLSRARDVQQATIRIRTRTYSDIGPTFRAGIVTIVFDKFFSDTNRLQQELEAVEGRLRDRVLGAKPGG